MFQAVDETKEFGAQVGGDRKIVPKLTPTGKISHAKTRVYTQRYRKEWEDMDDFRGVFHNFFIVCH